MDSIMKEDYLKCQENDFSLWGDLLSQVQENPMTYDSSPFTAGIDPNLMGLYLTPLELSPIKSEFDYIGYYVDQGYNYPADFTSSWPSMHNTQPNFNEFDYSFDKSYSQVLECLRKPPVVLSNTSSTSLSEKPTFLSNSDYMFTNCRVKGKKNRLPLIFECEICHKLFDRKYVLKRHRGTHSLARAFNCKPCKMSFYRKDIFDRHLTTKKCTKAHKLMYSSNYLPNQAVSETKFKPTTRNVEATVI